MDSPYDDDDDDVSSLTTLSAQAVSTSSSPRARGSAEEGASISSRDYEVEDYLSRASSLGGGGASRMKIVALHPHQLNNDGFDDGQTLDTDAAVVVSNHVIVDLDAMAPSGTSAAVLLSVTRPAGGCSPDAAASELDTTPSSILEDEEEEERNRERKAKPNQPPASLEVGNTNAIHEVKRDPQKQERQEQTTADETLTPSSTATTHVFQPEEQPHVMSVLDEEKPRNRSLTTSTHLGSSRRRRRRSVEDGVNSSSPKRQPQTTTLSSSSPSSPLSPGSVKRAAALRSSKHYFIYNNRACRSRNRRRCRNRMKTGPLVIMERPTSHFKLLQQPQPRNLRQPGNDPKQQHALAAAWMLAAGASCVFVALVQQQQQQQQEKPPSQQLVSSSSSSSRPSSPVALTKQASTDTSKHTDTSSCTTFDGDDDDDSLGGSSASSPLESPSSCVAARCRLPWLGGGHPKQREEKATINPIQKSPTSTITVVTAASSHSLLDNIDPAASIDEEEGEYLQVVQDGVDKDLNTFLLNGTDSSHSNNIGYRDDNDDDSIYAYIRGLEEAAQALQFDCCFGVEYDPPNEKTPEVLDMQKKKKIKNPFVDGEQSRQEVCRVPPQLNKNRSISSCSTIPTSNLANQSGALPPPPLSGNENSQSPKANLAVTSWTADTLVRVCFSILAGGLLAVDLTSSPHITQAECRSTGDDGGGGDPPPPQQNVPPKVDNNNNNNNDDDARKDCCPPETSPPCSGGGASAGDGDGALDTSRKEELGEKKNAATPLLPGKQDSDSILQDEEEKREGGDKNSGSWLLPPIPCCSNMVFEEHAAVDSVTAAQRPANNRGLDDDNDDDDDDDPPSSGCVYAYYYFV